jgi:transcriptional regulator with XRE-family HTH domain
MYDSTLTLTPLRLARLQSGAPQYVLAKRARLAASRLSVLERGYDEPSSYERSALARVLGIPAEELFPVPQSHATPAPAAPGASN